MAKQNVFLIMVTAENNNKFYNMVDNGNGTMTVTYGRVGTPGTTKNYNIYEWDRIYDSKTKKGYKDVSDSRNIAVKKEYKPLDDPEIQKLIENLQKVSRQYMETQYESLTVTQVMIDQAQDQLNELAKCIDKDYTNSYPSYMNKNEKQLRDFNKKLLELFQIIPRKMKKVEYELVSVRNINDDNNVKDAMIKKIVSEQSLLDSLKTQVKTQSQPANTDDNTILEAFNISMSKCTPEDMEIIKNAMKDLENSRYRVKRAWVLRNNERDEEFKEYLINHKLKNDDKTVKYYWHGTRTENVFSIMVNGLQLNPSNAHITGKMFGYGIYSAPKAQKSLGYTSLSGSYWASGRDTVGYMFLNAVIMGHKLVTDSQYANGIYLATMDENKFHSNFANYHSVYARAGSSLRNDECIVYNQSQVTSRYLVEFEYK